MFVLSVIFFFVAGKLVVFSRRSLNNQASKTACWGMMKLNAISFGNEYFLNFLAVHHVIFSNLIFFTNLFCRFDDGLGNEILRIIRSKSKGKKGMEKTSENPLSSASDCNDLKIFLLPSP